MFLILKEKLEQNATEFFLLFIYKARLYENVVTKNTFLDSNTFKPAYCIKFKNQIYS